MYRTPDPLRVVRLGRASRLELRSLHTDGDLRRRPFAEQDAALKGRLGYRTSDAWSQALGGIGHEAVDLVVNHTSAQRRWAQEHGVTSARTDLDIAFAQVRRLSPELLFVGDIEVVPPSWIDELRAVVPDLRLVVSWCGVAPPDLDAFRASDLVLSCVPELVERFRRHGLTADHLHHAFDRRILEHLTRSTEEHRITFAGQLLPFDGFHARRAELVAAAAEELPLTISSPRAVPDVRLGARIVLDRWSHRASRVLAALGVPPERQARLPFVRHGARRRDPPPPDRGRQLRSQMQPPRYGTDFLQLLHDSDVVLNAHNDVSRRWATNVRMFEATGVGSCLLTDDRDNLPPLFTPGSEVVTYAGAEECIERARWLLDHPDEREAIARRGQARTLAEHTYAHRAEEFDVLVAGHLRAAR